MSDVLQGKRLPRLDLLLALVQTLLGFTDGGHRPVPLRDPRVEVWRGRWSALQFLQSSAKQVTAGPAAEMQAETQADVQAGAPEIRRQLLEPVAVLVGEALGCETHLVIEKEKTSMGAVHRSMFREAMDADVYIDDLSGANPNVYLELGVRWALRDAVTVLVSPDIQDVRYNASASRVIRYGPVPEELKEAQGQITQAVVEGLRRPDRVDSPVREGSDYITVLRSHYEALAAENAGLRAQQGEDLLA